MFERLPEELLRKVARGFRIQDFRNLSLVSKTFHAIWTPRFWRTLCVDTAGSTGRPSSVNIKRIEECAHALQNASSSIQNVSAVVFRRDTRWKLWDYEKEEDWPNVACLHRQPPPEDLNYWRALQRAAPVAGWSFDQWFYRNQKCIEASIERMGEQLDSDPMDDIALAIQSVIGRIPAGQLQSFTWDLATCIPQAAFDSLFQAQPQLESITLTADACCKVAGESLHLPFRQLKRVILNSLPRSHVVPVRRMLGTNRGHLRDLQIEELVHGCSLEELLYGGEDCEDPRDRESTDERNGELVADPTVSFPSLVTLSLRNIDLTESMDRAFNISGLTSLTLRQCSRSSEFFKGIMARNSPLQLKALEFLADYADRDEDEVTNTLNHFLLSFKGLEKLYIGLIKTIYYPDSRDNFHPLWSTVGYHGSTLKNLVIHPRGPITRTDRACTMGGIQRNVDWIHDVVGKLEIPQVTISNWMKDPATHPLSPLSKLECLGVSSDPFAKATTQDGGSEQFLVCILNAIAGPHLLSIANWSSTVQITLLRPFTSSSRRLKLLHLRKTGSNREDPFGSKVFMSSVSRRVSGDKTIPVPPSRMMAYLDPDFARFLNWVFGREGIPSLEAVAFGDFANGHMSGKYLHNMFACRSSDVRQGYRLFDCRYKVREHEWRVVADKYADFLESCPVGPRVESWGHGSRYHF